MLQALSYRSSQFPLTQEPHYAVVADDEELCFDEPISQLEGMIFKTERVFTEVTLQESTSDTIRIPTCLEWIKELKSRTWSDSCVYVTQTTQDFLEGCVPLKEQNETKKKDCELLLLIAKKNNEVFSKCIENVLSSDCGYVTKVIVSDKSYICSHGDFHSDVASLVSLFEFLEEILFLDLDYRCHEFCKVILCGDYGGRGSNDIEIYILLLLWRLENPTSVFLIRGNHENIAMQKCGSVDEFWFVKNEKIFDDCYKSFPSAVCVASDAEVPEYVHFSHALFPFVDLAPLLDGTNPHMFLPEFSYNSLRFSQMNDQNTPVKIKEAFEHLNSLSTLPRLTSAYYWGDPGNEADLPCGGHKVCSLSAENIQRYAKVAGDKASIEFFVWGHQHKFLEISVIKKKRTKVIGIILAAGTTGGLLKKLIGVQKNQGIIFHVAPKVRDWEKQMLSSTSDRGFKTRTIPSSKLVSMHTQIN